MSPVHLIVGSVLVPGFVSLLVFVALRWVLRTGGVKRADAAAAALAIGLGYLSGHLWLAFPAFPPVDVTDRIPWILGAAMVLQLLEALRPTPVWASFENRVLILLLALGTILEPVFASTVETRPGQLWLAGLALFGVVSQINLDAQNKPTATVATNLSRLATLGAVALALLLSGSVVLGELGLALAAAYGAVVVSVRSRESVGGPILGATIAALVIDGYIYAALPARAAILLLVAPWLAWIGAIPGLRRADAWKSTVIVGLATLALIALAMAQLDLNPEPGYAFAASVSGRG